MASPTTLYTELKASAEAMDFSKADFDMQTIFEAAIKAAVEKEVAEFLATGEGKQALMEMVRTVLRASVKMEE